MECASELQEDIYVTCVCGAVIIEGRMSQHIENCLKDQFIKNSLTMKIISIPETNSKQPAKERLVCAKCARCGHPMYKNGCNLITFHPSTHDFTRTCCSSKEKSGHHKKKESVCKTCKLPSDFHEGISGIMDEVIKCIDDLNDAVIKGVDNYPPKRSDAGRLGDVEKHSKCRQKQIHVSQLLESLPKTERTSSPEDVSQLEHSFVSGEIPSGPPCKLFHVALLSDCSRDDKDSSCYNYSLLLQILDKHSPGESVGIQTDLSITTSDVGTQVNMRGVYPEEVQKLLDTKKQGYDVPEFDRKAEAAFRSHLSTLIPCSHCSRTFSPDRIQRHMSCCIEKPKSRKRTAPEDEKNRR